MMTWTSNKLLVQVEEWRQHGLLLSRGIIILMATCCTVLRSVCEINAVSVLLLPCFSASRTWLIREAAREFLLTSGVVVHLFSCRQFFTLFDCKHGWQCCRCARSWRGLRPSWCRSVDHVSLSLASIIAPVKPWNCSYPQQCSALRKNGYVMLNNRPCKIMEMSTSKTGKHGHAKVPSLADPAKTPLFSLSLLLLGPHGWYWYLYRKEIRGQLSINP